MAQVVERVHVLGDDRVHWYVIEGATVQIARASGAPAEVAVATVAVQRQGADMDEWRSVDLETWSDFYMALRSVLAELPPATDLLLQPDGDARVAHVTARPRPHVEIRTRSEQLASFRCDTITDVVDRVRSNVEDHWELDAPTQLAYSYEGDVSPRLRTAFADDELVHDLPEGDRPSPTAHTTGEDDESGLGGRLSPEVAEKLRRMGSSAIDQ